MRGFMFLLAVAAVPALAQPAPDRTPGTDKASEAIISAETPLADADDPINRQAQAAMVAALVVNLTLDGREARLDQAVPARVPRSAIQKRQDDGDRVTVIALVAGREVARASVPDQLIDIEEDKGIVRQTRRQISLAIPMERAPDALQVLAPGTGVDAMIDPGAALAMWCQGERPGVWCARRR